ncbi:uncharacterized protein N7484_008175 [Penicillium longicatenatum]|uniref:uncharacterized protein n=1 Tax=Penicillium longicatenatum TaxID=1561947 RepID=UPI0025467F9C|nr:uncharacterized protein N7484_008175 [Penicillium longicatenatum]KAJ5640313.1 hypothetical protein N7484_008175 [Penicillium longicatenatum]
MVDGSAIEQQDDGNNVSWSIHSLLGTRHEEIKCMVNNDSGAFYNSVVGGLRSFGFFGKTSLPKDTSTPLWEGWNFNPELLDEMTCGSAAGSLLCQSSTLLEHIPFEVIVQDALGCRSPELRELYVKYEQLNVQFYDYFMDRRESAKYLVAVDKNINIKEALEEATADPFIRAVVQNAYDCVQNKAPRHPDLDTPLSHFITGPLKEHFEKSQSDEVKLQGLKIIRMRYGRYMTDVSNTWHNPLNTCTDFIEDLKSHGPLDLARAITKEDHARYQDLNINSFRGDEAFDVIIRRCDNLTMSIQDGLDAQIFSDSEIFQLAQVAWKRIYLHINS